MGSSTDKNGKFKTKLNEVYQEEEGVGRRVLKNVPVIVYGDDGLPKVAASDFKDYGITLSGFQVTDWDFEKKTLDQISAKREETMAIITAKANAERAKQDAITSEQQGKANVMKAKYQEEVLKEKAIVVAERQKQVAVIEATQKVEVADQAKLEAEQKKLAAKEYKQEQILRGEGDAKYKKLVMSADGALVQKLEAWVKVNERYAAAMGKQKWVPEIQMGNGNEGGNSAQDLLSLFLAKTAKDVSLDISIPKK